MCDDPDELADAFARCDYRQLITLLMERYGDDVHRFVCELVRDDVLADDVHQQIFIDAYRDLPRFAGRSSIKTWLFGIAWHRCLDALKIRRRLLARFTSEPAVEQSDATPTPGERIDDARLCATLVRCLDEVSPETRTAILLRYHEDFTFEDMAAVCDEKAGTLQARVARALPALRACIESRTGARV